MESRRGAGADVEIRLLGPLEVVLAGSPAPIGSVKQRVVLALLALNAGRVVSGDALCDALWGDDPPAAPLATLQSLISRLRRTLAAPGGAQGRDVLRTSEPGWVLDADPDAVDALRFEALVPRARRRRGRGELEESAADLTTAVDGWRGPALVDLVEAGYLGAHATRLDEAHRDAVEDLTDAELSLGDAAGALGRIEAHVDANPLRERGWGLLMVALYRLGRQGAALRAYQEARAVLRDELGVEPSPDLAAIERQILGHDPALAGPVAIVNGRGADAEPAGAAGAGSAAERSPAGGEFADYRVVVVEDHDFQRRIVVQLLNRLGVGTVADAPDAVEALRLLEAGPRPDVVVCDIDMPGIDGVEFVTRVAERNLASAVVIASGLDATVLRAVETIGESHGLHVLAALEKPLTARPLAEALRRYTRVAWDPSDRASDPVTGDEVRGLLARGELSAMFEPRIDLATGAVSSASVRGQWHGRDGGPVDSSGLAAAVTREGLIQEYLERLFAEAGALLDAASSPAFRIAVDVSQLPLADSTLADWLAGLVDTLGHDGHRFVCEIDDLAIARAPASALQVLTRLRVKGFGLAMNHTGAGPSMAHLLDRLPVSELRLDRRLVSDAGDEPKRYEMLDSAMTAARDKGLPVVADGCDGQGDFDTLLALGCSEAQGRFVAGPMSATDLLDWARTGAPPK